MQEWRARYFSENHPFLFYAKALSYVTAYDGRTDKPMSERFVWPFSFIIQNVAMKLQIRWTKSVGLPLNRLPIWILPRPLKPSFQPLLLNDSWVKTKVAT